MRVIVFDTETTCLPKNYKANYNNWENDWGYIVQLSWILFDTNNYSIIDIQDHVIKIDKNVELTQESVNIHGITREKINNNGIHINNAIALFIGALESSGLMIGHNIEFDVNMIRAEIIRNTDNDSSLEFNIPKYCTMKSNIDYCNIITTSKYGRKYKKFPKLIELHEKLFNTTPCNLHDSMTDVIVTLRCYIWQQYNIDLYVYSDEIRDMMKEIIP